MFLSSCKALSVPTDQQGFNNISPGDSLQSAPSGCAACDKAVRAFRGVPRKKDQMVVIPLLGGAPHLTDLDWLYSQLYIYIWLIIYIYVNYVYIYILWVIHGLHMDYICVTYGLY